MAAADGSSAARVHVTAITRAAKNGSLSNGGARKAGFSFPQGVAYDAPTNTLVVADGMGCAAVRASVAPSDGCVRVFVSRCADWQAPTNACAPLS